MKTVIRIIKFLIIIFFALQADPCLQHGNGISVCLLFGYDGAQNGCLSEQTKARCDKAVEVYKRGKFEMLYITAAGLGENGCVANEMTIYLNQQGIPFSNIVMYRGGYNTAGEIDSFLKIAPPNCQITAISSSYHLPRIKLLFYTRGRFCQAYGSDQGNYAIEKLYEWPKSILTILFPHLFVERADNPE